jgi:hypothetical protein
MSETPLQFLPLSQSPLCAFQPSEATRKTAANTLDRRWTRFFNLHGKLVTLQEGPRGVGVFLWARCPCTLGNLGTPYPVGLREGCWRHWPRCGVTGLPG